MHLLGSKASLEFFTNEVSLEKNVALAAGDLNRYLREYMFDEVLKGKNQVEIRLELQGKGFNISKAQISDVLRNPVYIGKIVVPKEGDEEYQLVEGIHEAIVSEDVFYKVQNILHGKKKVQGGYFAKEELPLRGSLFCSKCGGHVTGSASRII